MFENMEVWFVTGAQLLYGGDAVVAVDAHSTEMVDGMNRSGLLPVKVVYKGTANSSKEVSDVMKAAENDARCIGVITWMHTFSPAKMWIHGMQELRKPLRSFDELLEKFAPTVYCYYNANNQKVIYQLEKPEQIPPRRFRAQARLARLLGALGLLWTSPTAFPP